MKTNIKDETGRRFLEQLESYPCWGGLDLAAVSDLTAFVLSWEIDAHIYCYPWFFLPKEGIQERCKHDGVPYLTWYEQGYLHLTEGSITDWRYVVSRIQELSKDFKIQEIGFDSWGARDVVRELMDDGATCVDVSQNIGSLTAPTKRLQEAILGKKLIHSGHPILRWNLDCSTIYTDPNGNIKVQKPPLNKSSKRVDGVIALIMAISRLQKTVTTRPSVYSTRGIRTL